MKKSIVLLMFPMFATSLLLPACTQKETVAASESRIKKSSATRSVVKSSKLFNDYSWLQGMSFGCQVPGNSFHIFTFGDKKTTIKSSEGLFDAELKSPADGVGFELKTDTKAYQFTPIKGQYSGLTVVYEFEDKEHTPFLCYIRTDDEFISGDGSVELRNIEGTWSCDGPTHDLKFDRNLHYISKDKSGSAVFVGSKSIEKPYELHFLLDNIDKSFVTGISVKAVDIAAINDGVLLFENEICTKEK